MPKPAFSSPVACLPRSLAEAIPVVVSTVDLVPATLGLSANGLTLAELAADLDLLESWLSAETAVYSDLDPKTQAAFMIGGLSWSMCAWLAALHVGGAEPVGAIAFRQERYTWTYGGLSGNAVRYRPELVPAMTPVDLRGFIEEQFAPLIAATMVLTGLSPGAQWRLVADSVARGFLYSGEALGLGPQARLDAERIIAEGRLNNGKTRFVQVAEGSRCQWFVSRGGCCRNYMVPGQETCSSCVLRKPDEQIAIIRQGLRTPR